MIVNVIVREVLERKLGLVTKFNVVKTYTLEMEPADVFSTFEEARQVWSSVGTAGIKWRGFFLGNFHDFPEHFRGTCLIETDFDAGSFLVIPNCF